MRHLLILILTLSNLYAVALNKSSFLADTSHITNDNVLYKVSQDDSYVYLNISTIDKNTAMSIIRNGLTVYYDIKGKKKKDVYVKYPYSSGPKKFQQGSRGNNDANASDLKKVIENLPIEAEYSFFKEKKVFNKILNGLGIAIVTDYTASNQLFEFSIKMAKAKISSKADSDFSKLTIGVVTNKMDENTNSERAQGQNSEMRSGGGGRGGSGGGGRGGNRGGGGMGRQNGQRPDSTIEKVTIDFWFDAK